MVALSALLQLAQTVRTAGELQNTKERIADVIEAIATGVPFPYDALVAYKPFQPMIYGGKIFTAKAAGTTPGENPSNAAAKWDSGTNTIPNLETVSTAGATSSKRVTLTGGLVLDNLDEGAATDFFLSISPTTGKVSVKSATNSIPHADTTNFGVVRRSTDAGLFTLDDPEAYVTQRQFAQFRALVIGARLAIYYVYDPDAKTLVVRVFVGTNAPVQYRLENTGSAESDWLDATADATAGPGYYKHTYANVQNIGTLSVRAKGDPGAGTSIPIMPQGIELGPLIKVIAYYGKTLPAA